MHARILRTPWTPGHQARRAGLKSDTFIEIDHVTFGYDERRTILTDLSLRFMRGKVTAVLAGRAAVRPRCCG